MAGKRPVASHKLLSILWLSVVVVVILGGCARFNQSPFVDQPYSYQASLPEKTGAFDFDQYMAFAWDIVSAWDPQAKLESVARLVNCDAVESDTDRSMLFSFYRPRLYWFGQRIEWLKIFISDGDDTFADVDVYSVPLNKTWHESSMDFAALTIDYSTALQMARERGGAVYEANQSTCYLRVVLVENQWNYEYMEDEAGVSDDKLTLCIDGVTGEPCEYFYQDTTPNGRNEDPTATRETALTGQDGQ